MAGRKIGELDEWRHRVGVHSAYLHHVRGGTPALKSAPLKRLWETSKMPDELIEELWQI